MNRIFKGAALLFVIVCGVWLAVLWRWEATARNMTVTDIVVYLGLLPCVMFAVLLGLNWAWRGAAPRRAAAIASAAAAKTAAAADAQTAAAGDLKEATQRHATVKLLGAHIVCAAAQTPAGLLSAASEGKPRPDLDAELRNADGLPVMSARIPDLQLGDFDAAIAAVTRQRAEWAGLQLSEHAQRALSALVEPFGNAVLGLQPWATRLGAPGIESEVGLISPAHATTETEPMVRVLLGWPSGWSQFECAVAVEWVRTQFLQSTGIPAERFVIVEQAIGGAELWLKADQLLQALAREARDDVLLVAACHSEISDAAVAELEQANRLFSSQHPKGEMPAEAAVALLIAGEKWPLDDDAPAPVHLHRPAVLLRDKSVEASGRVGSQCLQDAVTQALAAGRLTASDAMSLVTDGDQHSSRGAELFGATIAVLPHLEAGEDLCLIGQVTGHTGAVGVLLAVAVAAERARLSEAPCLAVSQGDSVMRLVLLARPPSLLPQSGLTAETQAV